jgi:LPXTG-motif cell wall-anchored protein
MSAALNYQQLQDVNKAAEQVTATEQAKKKNMALSPEALDTLLNTGLQATSTIVGQRAASGRSAARQARIAACGRKPLFGKKKKEAYRQCLEQAQGQGGGDTRSGDFPPPPSSDGGGSNTMMYVGIGLGVVLLGVVGFVLYRKFNK